MNRKLNKVISDLSILFLVLNYFVGYMYLYPRLLSILYYTFNLTNKMYDVLSFIVYLFMILASIIVGYSVLKESFEKLPKLSKLIESVILTFVVLFFTSGILNTLVTMITGLNESANQNQIIDAYNQNPLLIIFTTIIYAPIVEEIVFRGAIFRGLRGKTNFWISALVSGLLFGLIHVFDSLLAGNFLDLLFLLVYGALGFIFCYSYEKNHSIYAPMLLHFINNFIGVIGIIISSMAS